ncbi:MAG: transcriptional regulator [Loktanella sp.]|nr:transcriptional regulator [Loktanella sp.]
MTQDATHSRAEIQLTRTGFFLDMISQISTALEEVVGLEDAEGYFALVGSAIGADLGRQYRAELGHDDLSTDEIGQVLVDLKKRIDGGFRIESVEDNKITLVNTRCPFGSHVVGRRSLCMMTSNVFGIISAEASGRASVDIEEAFATGHDRCRVVVYLNTPSSPGQQYFAAQDITHE